MIKTESTGQELRLQPIATVYRTIDQAGPISRIQLARECLMAPGTLTRIARLLMDNHLVQEVASQASTGGRRPVSLAINTAARQLLAVRAGRSHFHLGLCDLSGKLIKKETVEASTDSEETFCAGLITAMRHFISANTQHITALTGVGITLPGLIDSHAGIVHFMPNITVNQLALAQSVQHALEIPCYIGNDTAAMCLAEHYFGTAQTCNNALFISIHNGVRAGMMIHGELYEGCLGAAGEIGHIQVDPLGQRCYCGNFGCLETLVCNPAIENRYNQLSRDHQPATDSYPLENKNIAEICAAAVNLEPLAVNVLKDVAKHLGNVIAMNVNLIRPEKIILSGEIAAAFPVIAPVIQHCMETGTVQGISRAPILEVSPLGQQRWLGGTALVKRALRDGSLLGQLLE
ncbi:ROK family protein [Kistimonas asteriae]|uniref:ROK family protein n=1 Tax=Kistimonas asteriae TaxID=517724 RepID=UPI001BA817C2|nr:ROK family protein [Kistimonas asteriae]